MTYRGAYNVLIKAWQGNKESEDYPDFDDINEALTIIGESLERLEQLEKAQDLEIENLNFIVDENKYQTSIRVLKEAFIVLGNSDITKTCWFKFLEELEKENQEMKNNIDSEVDFLTNELHEQKSKNIDLYRRYEKLTKAIDTLVEWLRQEKEKLIYDKKIPFRAVGLRNGKESIIIAVLEFINKEVLGE